MKSTLRVISALFVLVMMVSTFAACGNSTPAATTAPAAPETTTSATEASVPFVAPPDEIGLVISADSQLITWQPYETKEDTIDFKSVDVKALGEAGEMTLLYLEREVTYYSLVGGKLEKTTVEAAVPGSVVGVTTLEEGVMEVYILSVPAEEDETENEDPLGEFEEVTMPTESTSNDPGADEDSEQPEEPTEP